MQKRIIFFSEMPITNGVIQAQMMPIAFAAKKQNFEVYIIETTGRFDSQESGRKQAERSIKKNGIFLKSIDINQRTVLPSIFYFSLKTYSIIKKIIKENDPDSILFYSRNYKFLPVVLFANYVWKIGFIYSPRAAYVAERKYYKKIRDILFAGFIKIIEQKAFNLAALTIVETGSFKMHLKNHFKISQKKIKVIPNCWSENLLPPIEWDRKKMREKLGFSGKKVVVYAGTLEAWYDFSKMFDLVSKLKKKNPDIFFQMFFKEDYARKESHGMPEKIQEYVKKYGFTDKKDFNISSYPSSERYKYLSACDIGLCLTIPYEFKTMMLYLKIVDYWGAKLPVIINKDVIEVKDAINKSGAGAVVDYKNWNESIEKIELNNFFIKDRINWNYLHRYSSQVVIPQYLSLFNDFF